MKLRDAVLFERFKRPDSPPSNFQFSTTVILQGVVESDQLREAVEKLQQKHPLLRALLAFDEIQNPYLEEPEEIPEPRITEEEVEADSLEPEFREHPKHWNNLLIEHLGDPIDYVKEPFFKIHVLRAREANLTGIFLITQHTNMDGAAGITLMEDLLNFIAHPHVPQEGYTVLKGIYSHLLPEYKEEVDAFCLPKIKEAREKEPEERGPRVWPDRKPLGFQSFQLDRNVSKRIISMAKERGVKAHAALSTAMIQAFYNIKDNKEEKKRTLQFPMDLRRYMNPDVKGRLGCYITLSTVPVDLGASDDFWTIAAQTQKEIDKVIHDHEFLPMSNFWDMYFLPEEPYLKQASKLPPFEWPMDYEFSFSNLGKTDIKENYGEYKVIGCFAPTLAAQDEEVFGINYSAGKISFTLAYDTEHFSKDLGRKVIAEYKGILDKLCSES